MTSARLEPWDAADLEAVVTLLNRASEHDSFAGWNVHESVFDDPDHDARLLLCIREGGAIVAAAAAIRRPTGTGHLKLLAVAPERTRCGLATRLLDQIEARLARSGAASVRAFADAPSFLRPGVDFRLTGLISLLQRRGYEPRRAVVNMAVDLSSAPIETDADERRLRDGAVEVRRLATADEPSFGEYLETTWNRNWRIEALRSLRRDPVSTHVASHDGRLVGFATHSASGPGQFGPMGTSPELRGQGIGAVLLRRCLRDLRDQGHAECDIQWVGPIGFYADAVGARISRCFFQHEKVLSAP